MNRQNILKQHTCPPEYEANLLELIEKLHHLESLFGERLIVSSGYRTMEDHLRIYVDKGITDRSKIPMASKHLYCQAADITNPKLHEYILSLTPKTLEVIGLWYESLSHTSNWTHCQIVPPKSGNRFFIP
jgi:uncharacterized protein YcbK (DUF882 family)